MYPTGFGIADMVQGIDAFFGDQTNIRALAMLAYMYVMYTRFCTSPSGCMSLANRER